MSKKRLALLAALSLASCHRYELAIQPESSSPPMQQTLPAGVVPSDLYTVVYASAAPKPGGSAIDPCQSNFVAGLARDVQKTVTLSIVLQDGITKIPIYMVSQSGQNSCLVSYNARFIFSPQTFTNLMRTSLQADLLYDVKSTEKVTQYLSDANKLAGVVAPSGAPVVAAIGTILQSDIVNDIKNDVNNAFSQHFDVGLTVANLALSSIPLETKVFDMGAKPLDFSNKPTGEQDIPLGTLTITTQRTPSLFANVRPDGSVDYSTLQLYNTRMLTIVQGAQGTVAQSNTVFNLANVAPVQAAGTVASLGATGQPSPADVKRACDVLSSTLANLNLNRLDTVAFVWKAYTASTYSIQHETGNSKTSACLQGEDFKLMQSLGIQGWAGTVAAQLNEGGRILASVR